MRAAFLCEDFPLLSQSFVAILGADLLRAGIDLRVLALNRDGTGPPEPQMHEEVARSGLLERTARAGAPPAPRPGSPLASGPLRPLARLPLPARARLALGEPRFDVVHCQFATDGLAALRLLRLGALRTRALVVHLRGHDVTKFVAARGPEVYAGLFRRADLFIANSRFFAARAEALGCPAGKLAVIGSPVDTERFAPPPAREPFPGRPLRLVAVGRLVEKKGFADAIGALARLRGGGGADGREVTLDILGDGPLRDGLAAQAAAAGVAEAVRFHGAATQGEVIAALHRADIALAPSVTAASGDADAPVNTLKEAMATGLPVVATHHGGIPELVIPGENGALVPERDPAALAAAIAALADAPESWAALGAAGRAKVRAEYDRSEILRLTLAAYRRALGNGPRRGR